MDEDAFRERLHNGVDQFSRRSRTDESEWQGFAAHIYYQQADFLDQQSYVRLGERLGEFEQEWESEAQRIFYCATPSTMFAEIPPRLSEAGLSEPRDRSRIVIEKPIGHDLDSARQLNRNLTDHFEEETWI